MGDIGGDGLWWRSSPPPPDPAAINGDCLLLAEEAADRVVNCVHPTLDSEERRRDVIDHIQRLIQTRLHCQVFPYGSVPLKTYLPDGDIDLTALKVPHPKDSLALDVLDVLQTEEQNEYAEYQVRDTQFIDAEVKLVKCLVRNFIIDISFNQLGGLSTLCFLEQVDRIVGRDHLFKRSIILVKTWCYHESRILGAHHGLISTYALETLVLYIFHLFHSSLTGPLMVLYRFLAYYSKFDWENYCISLKGPVLKSSLPDVVVKMPESGWDSLMFTEEFLENCIDMFSVPSRGLGEKPKPFQVKHLNIMDPLRENNNLGRSVSKGNFYRIQSAFKYGARKLGQLLLQPRDNIAGEIAEFFANTLSRHDHQNRNVTHHPSLRLGDEESLTASITSPLEMFSEDDMLLDSSASDFDKESVGIEDKSTLLLKNDLDKHSVGELSEDTYGRAHDLPTSNSSLGNGTSSYTSSSKNSGFLSGNLYIRRQYFSAPSSAENGSSETGNSRGSDLLDITSPKFCFKPFLENHCELYNNTYKWCIENSHSPVSGSDSSTPKASILRNASPDVGEVESASTGESEAFNPLADLSGDYNSHIRSLLYGQFCHGLTSCGSQGNSPLSATSGIHNKNAWDIVRQSIPLVRSQLCLMKSLPASVEQIVYASPDSVLPATAFCAEVKRRPQGMGTYFPNVNGFTRVKPPHRRGKNREPDNHDVHHKHGHSKVIYPVLSEKNCSGNVAHDDLLSLHPQARTQSRGKLDLQCQSPILAEKNWSVNVAHEVLHSLSPQGRTQSRGKLDVQCQSPRLVGDEDQNNGESCKLEFGSIGNLAEELGVTVSTLSTSLEKQGTSPAMKQESDDTIVPVCFKNDDEFPPLR